jgi:D-serine deaminase-like pyridoxal phosphate-dependent protein
VGGQIEFLVPHCDPTVNLHADLHAHRGGKIVEVWSR